MKFVPRIILYFNGEKLRYLMVGMCNTICGYFIGAILFISLESHIHIFIIGIISNIITISISFISYKLIVFRTSENWISEYLRCYIVYGSNAILGIFLLWLAVDKLKFNIWVAQAFSILLSVGVSYILHKRFTFKLTSFK